MLILIALTNIANVYNISNRQQYIAQKINIFYFIIVRIKKIGQYTAVCLLSKNKSFPTAFVRLCSILPALLPRHIPLRPLQQDCRSAPQSDEIS